MSGSGCKIGTVLTNQSRLSILWVLLRVLQGLYAAVRSTSRPRPCAPLTGASSCPWSGTGPPGSVDAAVQKMRLEDLEKRLFDGGHDSFALADLAGRLSSDQLETLQYWVSRRLELEEPLEAERFALGDAIEPRKSTHQRRA